MTASSTVPNPPVFISYARQTSKIHAEALRRALETRKVSVYWDSADIGPGARASEAVFDALLASRLVVVFVDAAFFTQRYCVEELEAAMAAYRALARRGGSPTELEEALRPIVIALPATGARPNDLDRLPPEVRDLSWPLASESDRLAELIGDRLREVDTAIRERLERLGELAGLRQRLYDAIQMPAPQSLQGLRVYHETGLPPSIGDAFVGRARELLDLHTLLSTRQWGPNGASRTVTVEGGGGFGKTRLAVELAPGGLAAARRRRDAVAAQDLGHPHVGDPKAQLERLALNPAVAPVRVLSGQPQNALPPLRAAGWASAWRASGEGGPPAPDQIAVPAEQGLRPRHQRRQA